MLHLVQSEEGYVSTEGIEVCAELLDITPAEVAAVATFYTMFKRRPVGDYHVGVCTNTLCAVMGGDAIFAALKEYLGIGNDETTPDGKITLEHVECNAACDYAPVVMVNWEFFDNMTPEKARQLVDDLRAGVEVQSTRGARLCTWRQAERVLAGFPDGRADEGPSAGEASLAGLRVAAERGWFAPTEATGTAPEMTTRPTTPAEATRAAERSDTTRAAQESRVAEAGIGAADQDDTDRDDSSPRGGKEQG
jgi:NADH-quinone oxidoreductase subunit E